MAVFSILTLGCRANQADSEQIRGLLLQAGFTEVAPGQPCDLAVVNTCTVTSEADRKSRQMVRRQARLAGAVVATGCGLAKRGGVYQALPEEVHCLPPERRADILDFLTEEGLLFPEVNLKAHALDKPVPQLHTRALLKVQEGCTHMCAFCIVPYVRGRSRSLPLTEALQQVKALEKAGYREIVLTGIHLALWGREFDEPLDFADLIEGLIKGTETVRFRISSIEPMSFPDRIIDLMIKFPERLCPHLHLVIQHASDRILQSMHRDYTLEQYDALAERFISQVPGACLTTDVLVGFPGETEADMDVLCRYLERRQFYHLHVFPYSLRQGTAAAHFPDQVPEAVKKARAKRVIALGEAIKVQVLRSFAGTRRPVLVERLSEKPGFVCGTADNFIAVELPGGAELLGTIVSAEITPPQESPCSDSH